MSVLRRFPVVVGISLFLFLLAACDDPFKSEDGAFTVGLGKNVDIDAPTFDLSSFQANTEIFISGNYEFSGMAADDVAVKSVMLFIREYGAEKFNDPVPAVCDPPGGKKVNWTYTLDTLHRPDGSERPDKMIRVMFRITDNTDKAIDSAEFPYTVKNHPPEMDLQSPPVAFVRLRFPSVNPSEAEGQERMTLVTGGAILGQANDIKGIRAGYPQIKIWIGKDTRDGPENPEPPDDDPMYGYYPMDTPNEADGATGKEFRFPLYEWTVVDGRRQATLRALSTFKVYRFKIKVVDVDGREAVYPLNDAGYSGAPGYVQLYLRAGGEVPRFSLMDRNLDLIPEDTAPNAGSLVVKNTDTDYPFAGNTPQTSELPYRYIYRENSVVNGPFVLRVFAYHGDGIRDDATLKLRIPSLPDENLTWDVPGGIEQTIQSGVTELRGRYFTYTFPRYDGAAPAVRPNDATFDAKYVQGTYQFVVSVHSSTSAEASQTYSVQVDRTAPELSIRRVESLYEQDVVPPGEPGQGMTRYNVNGNVRVSVNAIENETGLRYRPLGTAQAAELKWLVTTEAAWDLTKFDDLGNYNAVNAADFAINSAIAFGNGAAPALGGYIKGDAADRNSFIIPLLGKSGSDWELASNSPTQWYLHVFARDEAMNVGSKTVRLAIDQGKDKPEITIPRTLDPNIKTLEGTPALPSKSLLNSGSPGLNVFTDGKTGIIPIRLTDDDSLDVRQDGNYVKGISVSLLRYADLKAASSTLGGSPFDTVYDTGSTYDAALRTLFAGKQLTASQISSIFSLSLNAPEPVLNLEPGRGIPLEELAKIFSPGQDTLPDGYYYIQIRAADDFDRHKQWLPQENSNPSLKKAEESILRFWFAVNSSGPTLGEDVSPPQNSFGKGPITFKGSVKDQNQVSKFYINRPIEGNLAPSHANYWRELPLTPDTTRSPDGNGDYWYSWELSSTDAYPIDLEDTAWTSPPWSLSDAPVEQIIKVRAVDGLGRESIYNWKIQLDRQPPTVSMKESPLIVQRDSSAYVNGILRFEVMATDNNGIAYTGTNPRYEVKYWFLPAGQTPLSFGSNDPLTVFDKTPGTTGAGTYLLGAANPFVGYIDTRSLTPGASYQLFVAAKDLAGNVSSLTDWQSFGAAVVINQGTDKPTLSFTQPGAVADSLNGLWIYATLEDDDGLKEDSITIAFSKDDGATWSSPYPVNSVVANSLTLTADKTRAVIEMTIPTASLAAYLGADGAKRIKISAGEDPAYKVGLRPSHGVSGRSETSESALISALGMGPESSLTLDVDSINDGTPAAIHNGTIKFIMDSKPPQLFFNREQNISFNDQVTVPLKGWLVESNPVMSGGNASLRYQFLKGSSTGIIPLTAAPITQTEYDALPSTGPVRTAASQDRAIIYTWEIDVSTFLAHLMTANQAKDPASQGFYTVSIMVDDMSGKGLTKTWGYYWDAIGPDIAFTSITARDVFVSGAALDESNTTPISIGGASHQVWEWIEDAKNASDNLVSAETRAGVTLSSPLKIEGTLSDTYSSVYPSPTDPAYASHVYFSYRIDEPSTAGNTGWIDITPATPGLSGYLSGTPGGKNVTWTIPLVKNSQVLGDGFHWVEIRANDALKNETNPTVPAYGNATRKIGFRVDTAKPAFIKPTGVDPDTNPNHLAEVAVADEGKDIFIASPAGGVYHNSPNPYGAGDPVFTLRGYLREANLGTDPAKAGFGIKVFLDGAEKNLTLGSPEIPVILTPLSIVPSSTPGNTDKVYRFDLTMPKNTFDGISGDGAHTLAIRLVDLKGNNTEMRWTFRKDTTGPEITFTSLEGANTITDTANPTVSGNVSDANSDISKVEIKIEYLKRDGSNSFEPKTGTLGSQYWEDIHVSTYSPVVEWQKLLDPSRMTTDSPPKPYFPEGEYRITVRAWDSAQASGGTTGNQVTAWYSNTAGAVYTDPGTYFDSDAQYRFYLSKQEPTMTPAVHDSADPINGAIQQYYLAGTTHTPPTAPTNGGGGYLAVAGTGDGYIAVKGTVASGNPIKEVRGRYLGPKNTTTNAQVTTVTLGTGTNTTPDFREDYLKPDSNKGTGGYDSAANLYYYDWVIKMPKPVLDANPHKIYTLYLQAEDSAGRIVDKNGEFGLDAVAPVIKIDEPLSRYTDKERPIVTGTVTIQGNVTEDNRIKSISYQLGNETTWHTFYGDTASAALNAGNELRISPPSGTNGNEYPANSLLAKMSGNIYAWTLKIYDTGMLFYRDQTPGSDYNKYKPTSGTGANYGDHYVTAVPATLKGTAGQVPNDYEYLYTIPIRLKAEDDAGNVKEWDASIQGSTLGYFPDYNSTRKDFTVWLNPEGDKPRVTVTNPYPEPWHPNPTYNVDTAPEKKINLGGVVGGAIRVSGTAFDNDWVHTVAIRVWDKSQFDYDEDSTTHDATVKLHNSPSPMTLTNMGAALSAANYPDIASDPAGQAGWYKANLVENGGSRVNWWAELDGAVDLAPAAGETRRTVYLEVAAWDAYSSDHLRAQQTGAHYGMILYIEKGVPEFNSVQLFRWTNPTSPAGDDSDYDLTNPIQATDKAAGKFLLKAIVRDDSGVASIKVRRGTGGIFEELLGREIGQTGTNDQRASAKPLNVTTTVQNGKYYLIYDFASGTADTVMDGAAAVFAALGAELDGTAGNRDIKNKLFLATGGATLTGGLQVIEQANTTPISTSNPLYFEYEVRIPFDSAALGVNGLTAAGLALNLEEKAENYPITLQATDITAPTAFVSQYPVSVQVDNFAPMGEYTGNSRNVIGSNYLLQGRAFDLLPKNSMGGTNQSYGQIGEIARVVLYFERNGSLISTREKTGGNVPTLASTVTNPALPSMYHQRYVDRPPVGASSFVKGDYGYSVPKRGNYFNTDPQTNPYLFPLELIDGTTNTNEDYYLEITKNHHGDRGFSTNGSDTIWSASFNVSGRLNAGEVILHYIIYDQAGNAAHYTQLLMVRNNNAIKIQSVTLGSNLWNLSPNTASNGEAKKVTIDYDKTNFMVRNKLLSVKVQLSAAQDGETPAVGSRALSLKHITGKKPPVSVSDETGFVKNRTYEITYGGDTYWESLGAPAGAGVGTAFRASERAFTGTGTAAEYTYGVSLSSPASLGSDLYEFVFSGDTYFGAGKITDAKDNKARFLLEVSNVDGTSDFAIIGLNVVNADDTAPRGGIWDFNPHAEAGIALNSRGDVGKVFYTNAASADGYPKVYDTLGFSSSRDDNRTRPGLFLERVDGENRKSGHVEPRTGTTADLKGGTAVYGRDTLSGQVILRGWAYDDQRINEVWVKAGTDTPIKILQAKITDGFETHLEAAPGQTVKVHDVLDLQGHRAEWSWVWNTQTIPVNTGVKDSVPIQVIVKDFGNGEGTGSKTVDLVPYITGFERDLVGGTAAARSKFGHYAVARGEGTGNAATGENITVQGFNLQGTGANTTLTVGGKAARFIRQSSTQAVFILPSDTASGLVTLKAGNPAREAVNSDSRTRNVYPAVNPWNSEETSRDDTERWTDRRSFRVWQSNNVTGSSTKNQGYFPNSWSAVSPSMSMTSAGIIHGAWSQYATIMVSRGTNNSNSDTLVRSHADDFDYTDIHYSTSGRPTTVYVSTGAYTQDVHNITNVGGVLINEGRSLPNDPSLSGQSKGGNGNGGTQNFYVAERAWRSYGDRESTYDQFLTFLDRFGDARVVTRGDAIHVSYYDKVDQAIKYWYNLGGTTGTTGANWTNAQYRANTQLRHDLLPRHWVNLDGGWSLFDDGYISFTPAPANNSNNTSNPNAQGSGTKQTMPSVRDKTGRSSDYHGDGANPTLPVTVSAGKYNAIDLTSGGAPVIVYFDAIGQKLKYAYTNSAAPYLASQWNVGDITAANSSTGLFVSLKIDSGDNLHIAYYNSANSTLEYIRGYNRNGTTGAYTFSSPVTVDSTGVTGKWADVTLDSSGIPWITYQDLTQANGITGGIGAIKVAYLTEAAGWADPKKWETMSAAIRYGAKDQRLNIEARPFAAASTDVPWKAAIGYSATDVYRMAYYVE